MRKRNAHARSKLDAEPQASTRYLAWGLVFASGEQAGRLVGRYYFFQPGRPLPAHLEGHLVAAFNTREIARRAARAHTAYPLKVVRIEATVRLRPDPHERRAQRGRGLAPKTKAP